MTAISDDLRGRIAAVLSAHPLTYAGDYCECSPESEYPGCGGDDKQWALHCDHVADAVIAELGAIPDRQHIDDEGRVWEWCGGQPGTWAWRITRLADNVTDWKAGQEPATQAAPDDTPPRCPQCEADSCG